VINGIPQLTVKELKRRIDAGEDAYLIDVREPYEYQIAQIGGKLIPQNEVPSRLAEIDRDREVIVQCRSGSAASASRSFSSRPATRASSTWPAASSPGQTRSTPKCQSTEGSLRFSVESDIRPGQTHLNSLRYWSEKTPRKIPNSRAL